MKALVLYDSEYGNTEQLAKAVGEFLTKCGEVRVVRVSEAEPGELAMCDLLVVGCPTQRHGMTEALYSLLEGVPSGALRNTVTLVFDTRYQMPRWLTGSAAEQVAHKIKSLGCREVLIPESFFVSAREGPLIEGELERSVDWIRTAVEIIGIPTPVGSLG